MRSLMLTTLAVLAVAAPAGAQITATASPNTPGASTAITVDIDATQPPISGRVPATTTLTAQPGFVLDPVAVASRCTPDQGTQNACPADAKIGTATVVADTPFGQQTVTLGLFLGAPQQPGDLAALIASGSALGMNVSGTGRLLTASDGSLQAIITTPPAVTGFASSITVRRITAQTDARTRVVKRTKRVKVKRKHRRPKYKTVVVSRKRHDLLTTPPACTAGAWTASVNLAFTDGSTADVAGTLPCSP